MGVSLDGTGASGLTCRRVPAGDAADEQERHSGALPAAGPQRAAPADRQPGREGDPQLRPGGDRGPGRAGAAGVLDLPVLDPATAVSAAAAAEVEVLDSRRLGCGVDARAAVGTAGHGRGARLRLAGGWTPRRWSGSASRWSRSGRVSRARSWPIPGGSPSGSWWKAAAGSPTTPLFAPGRS
jgi:hypothetical protein